MWTNLCIGKIKLKIKHEGTNTKALAKMLFYTKFNIVCTT